MASVPPFPAETAVNIAYACNIFEEEMDGIFIVEGKNDETVRQELRYRWENCHSSSHYDSHTVRRNKEDTEKWGQKTKILEIIL